MPATEGWGVLSTDSGSDCTLTAINSRIAISPEAVAKLNSDPVISE